MHHAARTLLVSFSLTSTLGLAAEGPLRVSFYPQGGVRPYEVDARRGWSGALLQNAAIVNESAGAVALERVELDLLSGDNAIQTHRLFGPDLDRAARKGAGLQRAGLLELYAFQFRPEILLGKGVGLSETPRLEPRSALLVGHRYFVFGGSADRIRVRVIGRGDDGAPVEVEGSVPIASAGSRIKYRFPLSGRWFVGMGQALHHHHRWVVPEEFALDIARLGEGGATHRGDGAKLADYYAHGADVLAAADGVVVSTEGSISESAPMPRRPGESGEQYEARLMAAQNDLLAKGFLHAAGNHVVIAHEGGEHSFYAHLMPGSLRVRKGDLVKAGQVIARLGNSGNSTEPHLHFHVTDGADPILSAGVPITFQDLELLLADGERAVQSGDPVEAR